MVIHEESLFYRVLKYDYSLKLPLLLSLSYVFGKLKCVSLNKTLFKNLSPDCTELIWLESISNYSVPHTDLIKLSSNYSRISINTYHLCEPV